MSDTKYNCEFAVEGMHCAACELTIEKKLSKFEGVERVSADLNESKVRLKLKEGVDGESIRSELSNLIEQDGYKLVRKEENINHQKNWKDLVYGGLIATIIVLVFLIIQNLGIVNLINTKDMSLPFVFFIGVVASLSTCMAVVGGLVISLSSKYAKEKRARPLVYFHVSRLIGFFLLGGVMGLIGSAFDLTSAMSFILNLTLFIVMVVMGLNLLDIFPWARKLQIKMPKSIGRNVLNLEDKQGSVVPILLGAVTFFLPCGFTQSIQLYSLTTGSFVSGALVMFVFALGTLPILALISVASVKLSKTLQSGLFFKTSGMLVLLFAIFNFISAMVAAGIIEPIFNF
jgi:sulfite exporter TauE/SafE/copper chaperone CopZ